MGVATAAAILVAVPPVAALAGLHRMLNGPGSVAAAIDSLLATPWVWIPALILGIVAHELIHGLAWALAGRLPLQAIRFGMNWKALSPHAQCTMPLPASAYRRGAAAPSLVLGLVPAIAGSLFGEGGVAAFGWLMIIGAGGDIVVLWLLRKLPGHVRVEDHPTRAGCVAVNEPASGNGV
ncbi:MAG TPA: DUF3267 domain-containing protein [Gemmatimonadales bacterium]|nr:DUF3267 domain-containing protein [Gemmatimonadales bacterium]